MKYLKRIFLIFSVIAGISVQAQSDNIFAVVSGDTVTLWQTGASRNCGSSYIMTYSQQGNHLDWRQLDSGATANCYCYFDLSVTLGPFEAGEYTADVFHTEAWSTEDTIFDGSTSFIIGGKQSINRSGILSQSQSDCYQNIGLIEKKTDAGPDFNIFPSPVRDIISLEINQLNEEAVFEIFSINGIKLFSKNYEKVNQVIDQLNIAAIFPGSGIYIATLKTKGKTISKKISVL
jgi:hypothetical protein